MCACPGTRSVERRMDAGRCDLGGTQLRHPLTSLRTYRRAGNFRVGEEQIIRVTAHIVPGSIRRAGCVVDMGAIIEYDEVGYMYMVVSYQKAQESRSAVGEKV